MATPTACEVCGCTEARACDGGCGWSQQHAAVGRAVCDKPKCLTVAGQRDARLAKKHGLTYAGPESVADLRR
jgi:hypothetical protein